MDASKIRSRVMQSLSGGEQTRIHLARLFASGAEILLADEPTSALDPKHALDVLAALRRKTDNGALVIAALHDLDLAARYCTRVIVIDDGRVAADGAPVDALSEAVIKETFRVHATYISDAGHTSLRLSPID
jgi:iron complex transport system ATP-binding protein